MPPVAVSSGNDSVVREVMLETSIDELTDRRFGSTISVTLVVPRITIPPKLKAVVWRHIGGAVPVHGEMPIKIRIVSRALKSHSGSQTLV